MVGHTLLTFPPLKEGILLRRYKRFLADIELESGEIVTAHCANTGPMTGVLHIGGKVRIRHAPSPKRKLAWTWEQVETEGPDGTKCWAGINTSLPNLLVRLAIEAGFLKKELGSIAQIQKEVIYGKEKRSRIDLLLKPIPTESDQRQIYVEVKNTTWKKGRVGLFPDTVTERGQKHLKELMGVLPHSRSVLIPCISRRDIDEFAPGDEADPSYGKLFRLSLDSGVEVIPCSFGFHIDKVTWEGKKPFKRSQPS